MEFYFFSDYAPNYEDRMDNIRNSYIGWIDGALVCTLELLPKE